MIWDQTYGDFGTYEEAQITTAAKGADAMNPGLTMNLVVKSGSNTFRGSGIGELPERRHAVQQRHAGTARPRATRRAPTSSPRCKDFYGEIGGPILKDKLWFYASHRDASSGNFIPGFVRLSDREQVEFYTKLQDPTAKITYQVTQEQQVRGHVPGRPQVAAVSHGQPLRAARIDAEPGLVCR